MCELAIGSGQRALAAAMHPIPMGHEAPDRLCMKNYSQRLNWFLASRDNSHMHALGQLLELTRVNSQATSADHHHDQVGSSANTGP